MGEKNPKRGRKKNPKYVVQNVFDPEKKEPVLWCFLDTFEKVSEITLKFPSEQLPHDNVLTRIEQPQKL